MNNKGISDLNDFIFNKSFIMMSNNTSNETFTNYNNLVNSFDTPNLYFYNIDFKIDKTSNIKLNDKIVNYLLPLSTQQFFYKTNDDDYYNIENTQLITMQPDQISELYFNPSFDESNIFPNFLINNKYYANVMIDLIINNLELIITQNKDYETITNLIDNINNKFINTFSNYLNDNKLYGNMSNQLLSWFDELNKINIFDKYIPLSITKYNNDNYFNYTQNAFRYIKDNITNYQPASTTVKFSKLPIDYLNNIKILSPIFTKYSSYNKISSNLYNYLLSISSFYTEHIKYINNNMTFLNVMNPNIYIDKYLSNNLITKKINDTFYDNENNVLYIQILYPFIDINYDKIIINDTELIDFVIDRTEVYNNYIYKNNNIKDIKITTNTVIDNKIENLNYDTTQKSINRTTLLSNKFNNIGIFYINENHKIEITDKYSINNNSIKLYKFDDNNIYIVFNNKLYTNNEGFNIILLKNFMVINPYEITFNNKTDKTITLLKDNTNNYFYKIYLSFDVNITLNLNTNIYINLELINVDIITIDNKLYLYFITQTQIKNFNDTNILYQSIKYNNSTWTMTPDITEYKIISFKEYNYTCNETIPNNSIYTRNKDVSDYFSDDNILKITDSLSFNKCYFYLTENTNNDFQDEISITIFSPEVDAIYTNIEYTLKSSLIINNGSISQYYPNDVIIKDEDYLLLINNDIHYMFKYNELVSKQIPSGNYQTFIYPNKYLNLIQYDINLTIDENGNINNVSGLPFYSYYLVKDSNKTCIYYYETGSIMYANEYNTLYFNINNIVINSIWLIDNTLFKNNKHLLKISTNINASEDYVNNILSDVINSDTNIDYTNEYVFYKSKYANIIFKPENYNVNYQNEYNEFIVKLLLNNNNNNQRIIYPIIVKDSITKLTNPLKIKFSYNNVEYERSVIPLNINNYNLIGVISDSFNCSFESTSPNIVITKQPSLTSISFNNYTPIINELVLWKLLATNNVSNIKFSVYFWTFITDNVSLITSYINSISAAQPFFTSSSARININTNFTFINSVPNVFTLTQPDNYLSLKDFTQEDCNISYKYYMDNRDYNEYNNNIYEIKKLDYNSTHNIKPYVELLTNNDFLNKNIIFYILTYLSVSTNKQIILPILKSDFTIDKINDSDISNLSIYYSINNPVFINNNITLTKNDDFNYQITNYDKLYLEMNEIIIINCNYFIVNGLNVFNNYYELTLLINNNDIKYINNGYYTLGNYLAKDNNVIPNIEYENLMYYKMYYTPINYELYLDNYTNTMKMAESYTPGYPCINIFKKHSITFKLFQNNNSLYLFDDFIKLKTLDYIVLMGDSLAGVIYKIKAIIDNQIFLDNNPTFDSNYNNKFVNFILPYQPFEIISLNFDENGLILSNIENNQSIILDDLETNNIIPIINNIFPLDNNYNGKLVKLWKTNYNSNYNNIMYVPPQVIIVAGQESTNKYSMELDTIYNQSINGFKIVNFYALPVPSNEFTFEFYYLQPVKINGTYNYVKCIINNGDYYVILLNPITITNINVKIAFSPSFINKYNNYLYQKFDYNFCIQPYNFKSYEAYSYQLIEVSRYIIENDKLIMIQTLINNKKILFTYGKSITENEIDNNITDGYKSIYFYNSYQLNSNGKINNFNTLIDSYHQVSFIDNNKSYVYLAKIIYPNKLKFYSLIDKYNDCYIDKLMNIKVNYFGDFIYSDIVITQSKNLLDVNKDLIKIINKYEIKIIGTPNIIDNKYYQEVIFTTNKIIDTILYDKIYIDTDYVNSYSFILDNNKYYIISDSYLSNNFNIIYTVINNYLVKLYHTQNIKTLDITDESILNEYINTQIINNDILIQDIKLSNINNKNTYNYRLINETNNIDLNIFESNKINISSFDIDNINYIIKINNTIDNDKLNLSNNYIDINLSIINSLDTSLILNTDTLFPTINELKLLLINKSITYDYIIYNHLKPWYSWSLLNSIIKVSKLSNLVNLCYITSNGNISSQPIQNVSFSYLSNDEVKLLKAFIISINSSNIKLYNFFYTQEIETLIFDNLNNWVNNPDFFINVKQNINDFLLSNGYNVYFNGTNLIFNNDPNPELILIDNVYEIVGYISNEFTYDETNNIVYRSLNSYNLINNEILNWINKTNKSRFGVNIHKLLRYLVLLGDELNNFINNISNNLTDTTEYIFNNPLKFMINKIWEKYFIQNKTLDKLNNLQYNITFENIVNNLTSLFEYNSELNIKYYKFDNYNNNNEKFIYNISLYYPYIDININNIKELSINTIFPYTISFVNNVINVKYVYSIHFINGINISNDIIIIEPILYPGQINFNSNYNIKQDEFIYVKQTINYMINKSILLGYLYTITFNNINYSYIDNVYYNNVKLNILSKNSNNINLLIPFQYNELGINELLEIHNNVAIKNIIVDGDRQYIEFYNNNFNYIENKTLLKIDSQTYILKNYNNKYYINGPLLNSYNVVIITLTTCLTINNLEQVLIQYNLNSSIDSSIYNPSYFDFNIINSIDNNIITPINVNILDDTNLIFYYSVNDYKTISYNLYYFDFLIPATSNTIIYLYNPLLDTITNNIPTNDLINKVSYYFKQTGTQTIFSNPNLYSIFDLNNNIKFIQKNSWNITDFTINNNKMSFIVPYDFILNITDKYNYYLNNVLITNKIKINIINGKLYIPLPTTITDTIIEFKQFYTETEYILSLYPNQPNYNIINNTTSLGETSINKVIQIEKTNEYLYKFNFILPSTTNNLNTEIYLYDKNNDNIYTTFEPINNPLLKKSIYINQTKETIFTTNILYSNNELSNNISFVYKNYWNIEDYIIKGFNISFVIPNDFILNTTSKYYYKLNDVIINPSNFLFENGIINIKINYIFEDTYLTFKQYYVESDNSILYTPLLNTSIKITFDKPYQYTDNDKFYILPYTTTKKEFDNYLYIINTGLTGSNNNFVGLYNNIEYITLYKNNIEYKCKIFDRFDNQYINYIISSNEELDINNILTYSFDDNIIYTLLNINFYQNTLQYCNFYNQESLNIIYLFMDNNINEYIQTNINLNSNKFYLITYNDYKLVNIYYNNNFIQNNDMKRSIINNTNIITTIEDPIFNSYSKLFEYYSLYFNDQLIEEINEDIININSNLYLTDTQQFNLDRLCKINFTGDKWELFMPLIFWFCNKPGLSIPTVSLPYTDIILKYKMNELKNIISNDLSIDYKLSSNPDIKITLLTDYILLDSIERTLFGSYSHEYIINRYKTFPNIYIKTKSLSAHGYMTGLIKDIFFISKPLNSNLTFYTKETEKYDIKYKKYRIALEYYNQFIINNVYTSSDQINYTTDIEIIKNNMIELNIYNTTNTGNRIKTLLDNFDSKYLNYFMYYCDKYLSKYIIKEQIYTLQLYLKFQYSDKIIIDEISPLEALSIKVNGSEIFVKRDSLYYNCVIPYSKFKNSIPTGYYVYSFSLYPLEDQHSGHLNFTHFDDIIFSIDSASNVINNPYLLNVMVKEYNILRIMSGIGSLAWIS